MRLCGAGLGSVKHQPSKTSPTPASSHTWTSRELQKDPKSLLCVGFVSMVYCADSQGCSRRPCASKRPSQKHPTKASLAQRLARLGVYFGRFGIRQTPISRPSCTALTRVAWVKPTLPRRDTVPVGKYCSRIKLQPSSTSVSIPSPPPLEKALRHQPPSQTSQR